MYEERVALAAELHKQGHNCCQSVVAAFGDLYGFTREQCLKMSAAYGGGIGRMKETCGAALGLFMLAGLETGSVLDRVPVSCDEVGSALRVIRIVIRNRSPFLLVFVPL